jgi:FG-GAP-like repeat
MSLGVLTFNDPGGALAITDATTVSRSFSFTTFGLWARIQTLTITLSGLSHTFPADLDFLFVGPDGTNLAFWSDAGGGTPISNQNISIRDSAAALLPSSGGVATGTYRPADYGGVETNSNWTGLPPGLVINHPTPNGAATLDASFAGKWIDNTTWTLFVRDDAAPDSGTLNDWGIQATLIGICKPHDFNGTLTGSASDILWQNNDGTPGIWLMNGFTATSVGGAGPNGPWPSNPGPSWHVMGDADFDFDGKSDILWQNDDGTPAIWLMNGMNLLAAGLVVANPGPTWHIKGSGDFNNDGRSDILWQNDDGTPAIWLMDGMNLLAAGLVGTNPGPAWHIVGSGDYDIDQRSDILWQNDDGTPAIWTMNGLSVLAAGVAGLFNPGADWSIIG